MATSAKESRNEVLPLESMPDIVFEQILGFISFHELATFRRVSRKFNNTCSRLLNQGFKAAEKFHGKCLKDVKAKLPRRESERRNHKLSRHSDILSAIETRISLLSMTFLKYVDNNICCFIPGKVIDEIFSVLRVIERTMKKPDSSTSKEDNPPRAFEILQELRDISSMAMEYFDDKIVPGLKVPSPMKYGSPFSMGSGFQVMMPVKHCHGHSMSIFHESDASRLRTPSSSKSLVPYPTSEPAKASRRLRLDFERLTKTSKKVKKTSLISRLRKQNEVYKSTVDVQNNKIVDMDKKIDQQNEIIQQQNAKIAAQAEKIEAIHRRIAESGIFAGVVQEPKKDAVALPRVSVGDVAGCSKKIILETEDITEQSEGRVTGSSKKRILETEDITEQSEGKRIKTE